MEQREASLKYVANPLIFHARTPARAGIPRRFVLVHVPILRPGIARHAPDGLRSGMNRARHRTDTLTLHRRTSRRGYTIYTVQGLLHLLDYDQGAGVIVVELHAVTQFDGFTIHPAPPPRERSP